MRSRGLCSKIIIMTEAEKQKEIKRLQAIIDKRLVFTHLIKMFKR